MQVLPERSQLSGTHHLCRRSFDVFTDLNISTTGQAIYLDTDASNESVGAVLSQEIDGQERVVAYWSKCLSKPERNYCVTRKELLAIVKAIEHFHHYLYGQKFLLRTDHASLTWLMNFRNTEGQVARWIQRLNEYYFDIRHRKGSSHGNAMPFQEDHAQKIVVIVPE
ncbi:retrovirus-related Pol polyprotein from transposon opus [Trichonephila clavipes]|nr:retrovirus-related Pol polyprotein from transposon opus [Trichonephila clavipes]